jgi:two-component system KDP operon response regulator KdpE
MMNAATILVVDDEPQIRRVMLTTLASQGYSVVEVRSGEEALEKVRDMRPDLILLDVNLPGISGLETCREIRATCDAPIIMLTVRNTERDKVQALDAGADDYVVKPFGVEELMARIRAALRRAAPSAPKNNSAIGAHAGRGAACCAPTCHPFSHFRTAVTSR